MKTRKVLALILSLCLVIGLFPAMGVSAAVPDKPAAPAAPENWVIVKNTPTSAETLQATKNPFSSDAAFGTINAAIAAAVAQEVKNFGVKLDINTENTSRAFSQAVEIPDDVTVTLDLNGSQLSNTGAATIVNKGYLYIMNSNTALTNAVNGSITGDTTAVISQAVDGSGTVKAPKLVIGANVKVTTATAGIPAILVTGGAVNIMASASVTNTATATTGIGLSLAPAASNDASAYISGTVSGYDCGVLVNSTAAAAKVQVDEGADIKGAAAQTTSCGISITGSSANAATVIVNGGKVTGTAYGILTGDKTAAKYELTVNGGTITSTSGAGIYLTGIATTKADILGGTITGAVGVQVAGAGAYTIGAAAATEGGSPTGPAVTGNGTDARGTADGGSGSPYTSTNAVVDGAALSVINRATVGVKPTSVKVYGGTFTGKTQAVLTYAWNDGSGTLPTISAIETTPADARKILSIKGGTFSSNPKEVVDPNVTLVAITNWDKADLIAPQTAKQASASSPWVVEPGTESNKPEIKTLKITNNSGIGAVVDYELQDEAAIEITPYNETSFPGASALAGIADASLVDADSPVLVKLASGTADAGADLKISVTSDGATIYAAPLNKDVTAADGYTAPTDSNMKTVTGSIVDVSDSATTPVSVKIWNGNTKNGTTTAIYFAVKAATGTDDEWRFYQLPIVFAKNDVSFSSGTIMGLTYHSGAGVDEAKEFNHTAAATNAVATPDTIAIVTNATSITKDTIIPNLNAQNPLDARVIPEYDKAKVTMYAPYQTKTADNKTYAYTAEKLEAATKVESNTLEAGQVTKFAVTVTAPDGTVGYYDFQVTVNSTDKALTAAKVNGTSVKVGTSYDTATELAEAPATGTIAAPTDLIVQLSQTTAAASADASVSLTTKAGAIGMQVLDASAKPAGEFTGADGTNGWVLVDDATYRRDTKDTVTTDKSTTAGAAGSGTGAPVAGLASIINTSGGDATKLVWIATRAGDATVAYYRVKITGATRASTSTALKEFKLDDVSYIDSFKDVEAVSTQTMSALNTVEISIPYKTSGGLDVSATTENAKVTLLQEDGTAMSGGATGVLTTTGAAGGGTNVTEAVKATIARGTTPGQFNYDTTSAQKILMTIQSESGIEVGYWLSIKVQAPKTDRNVTAVTMTSGDFTATINPPAVTTSTADPTTTVTWTTSAIENIPFGTVAAWGEEPADGDVSFTIAAGTAKVEVAVKANTMTTVGKNDNSATDIKTTSGSSEVISVAAEGATPTALTYDAETGLYTFTLKQANITALYNTNGNVAGMALYVLTTAQNGNKGYYKITFTKAAGETAVSMTSVKGIALGTTNGAGKAQGGTTFSGVGDIIEVKVPAGTTAIKASDFVYTNKEVSKLKYGAALAATNSDTAAVTWANAVVAAVVAGNADPSINGTDANFLAKAGTTKDATLPNTTNSGENYLLAELIPQDSSTATNIKWFLFKITQTSDSLDTSLASLSYTLSGDETVYTVPVTSGTLSADGLTTTFEVTLNSTVKKDGTVSTVITPVATAAADGAQVVSIKDATIGSNGKGTATFVVQAKSAGTSMNYKVNFTVSDVALYTITVAEAEHGSVTTLASAAEGASVALDVKPDEGYVLDTLTVKDASGSSVAVSNNAFTMPASEVTVTATFKVDAPETEKTLTGITVTAPTKTTYKVGDTFDATGLVVTAAYSDETTADVTAQATCTEPDLSTTGPKTVTVSYTEGGVEKTANFTVTVTGDGTDEPGDDDKTAEPTVNADGTVDASEAAKITAETEKVEIAAESSDTVTLPAAVTEAIQKANNGNGATVEVTTKDGSKMSVSPAALTNLKANNDAGDVELTVKKDSNVSDDSISAKVANADAASKAVVDEALANGEIRGGVEASIGSDSVTVTEGYITITTTVASEADVPDFILAQSDDGTTEKYEKYTEGEVPTNSRGYFTVDGTTITIYTKHLTLFAFGYNDPATGFEFTVKKDKNDAGYTVWKYEWSGNTANYVLRVDIGGGSTIKTDIRSLNSESGSGDVSVAEGSIYDLYIAKDRAQVGEVDAMPQSEWVYLIGSDGFARLAYDAGTAAAE